MRLLHVLIPDERRDSILDVLDEKDVDYVVVGTADRFDEESLVEFPLPTDGVSDVMNALHDAGVEENAYTVIGTAETASTSNMERLQNRYADDFDPLTRQELRSKSRDMARDRTSFVWMIFLSAIIATAGLLVDSPAVVVGSMVIAPIVGPVLTASVGAATGDAKMLADSVWLQAVGLTVAVASATAFGFLLKTFSFVPQIELNAIDLISARVAPNLLTVAVGLAGGGAAAFGLTTKGPTSVIGVMIAAALIPAAATVGIALVWGFPIIALGSLIVLLISIIGINVAAFATLWYLGYRPNGFDRAPLRFENPARAAVRALAVLGLLVVVVGATFGTYQQITYERAINQEIGSILDSPAYSDLTLIQTSVQYGHAGGPFEPETVTISISRTSGEEYPGLANRLRRRIDARTGRSPAVRVHFVDYQTADSS